MGGFSKEAVTEVLMVIGEAGDEGWWRVQKNWRDAYEALLYRS